MPGPSLAAALLAASLLAAPDGGDGPRAVLVTGGVHFGSGIVWDAPAGLVLTALHVVEQMPEIWISVNGGGPVPARIADAEPRLDLALLRADRPLPQDAAIRRPAGAAAAGEPVTVAGYPGRRAGAARGKIVDPDRRLAGARYLEIGVLAEPGASGGPVLDARGAVVGVVDLALPERESTLAIPIDVAFTRFPAGAARDAR